MANVALCLASMGDPDAPLELLLHAWTSLSSSGCRNTARSDVAAARPAALLLSRDACEMEFASSSVHRLWRTRLRLLWNLYQAASLARDWSTCLISTEEMQDGRDRDDDRRGVARGRGDVALVFALLQCRRTSAAQDAASILLPKLALLKSETTPDSFPSLLLLRSVAELYHANALLHDEDCDGDLVEN